MKELIHKIRQIFMGTRVIDNRAKYLFLAWGCSGIHLVFTVLMFIGHVPFLAGLNLFATLYYAIAGIFIVPTEKFKLLFLMAFFEIELNASISSVFLGDGYDFMLYTLTIIPVAFYLAHTWPTDSKNKYGFSMIPIHCAIAVSVMYVLVDLLYTIVPPRYDNEILEDIRPIIHYFDIMVAIVLLIIFSILFALEVRYIEKLLGDENSRLGEIASRDPLTKALNRRSLYDIILKEIAADEQIQFGLILLDIDDFKKVNDTYGHLMGDQVLIRLSAIMRESIREDDYFCRWGGEEFLIFVHGTTEDCVCVAERIRSDVASQTFTSAGIDFAVTVTMGISEYQTGLKIRTLIDMADQKLYFGKNHGKNQVVR